MSANYSTPRVRAAAYYRMSTDKPTQEDSIPRQRDDLRRFATEQGYDLVPEREYEDAGISGGKTDNRDGWLRMREDATRGAFEVILIWKLDRFSRMKPHAFFREANDLIRAGIRLVSFTEGPIDWETPEGQLMLALRCFAAHKYLPDLSRT